MANDPEAAHEWRFGITRGVNVAQDLKARSCFVPAYERDDLGAITLVSASERFEQDDATAASHLVAVFSGFGVFAARWQKLE
ncbi:MAG: hypothetical protein AAFW60_10630 [Pseudomonadota bacterium]